MYGLFELQVTSAFTAFLSGGLLLIPLLVVAFAGLFNDFSDRSADTDANAAKTTKNDLSGRGRPAGLLGVQSAPGSAPSADFIFFAMG